MRRVALLMKRAGHQGNPVKTCETYIKKIKKGVIVKGICEQNDQKMEYFWVEVDGEIHDIVAEFGSLTYPEIRTIDYKLTHGTLDTCFDQASRESYDEYLLRTKNLYH
jgi:hypothetical protein